MIHTSECLLTFIIISISTSMFATGPLSTSTQNALQLLPLVEDRAAMDTLQNPGTKSTHRNQAMGSSMAGQPANMTDLRPSRSSAQSGSTVPIYDTCSLSQSFALTFDDGPTQFSSQLDKLLEGYGTRGTYFINGNNFGCIFDHADALIERFKKGHLIGSHTWSHVHLNQATREQVHDQLARLEQAMILMLGVRPLYFRPPYGEYNELVLQVLAERGYQGIIMWTEDSQDSKTPSPQASEIIETYNSWPEKTLVLNHETHEFTVDEVIPGVLPMLQKKGLKLMTVHDCLSLSTNPENWYQVVQMAAPRNASWTCEGSPSPGEFS